MTGRGSAFAAQALRADRAQDRRQTPRASLKRAAQRSKERAVSDARRIEHGKSNFCQNRCAKTASNGVPTHTTCSLGVIDNITTGGSDSFNLLFDYLDAQNQYFFSIGANPRLARLSRTGDPWWLIVMVSGALADSIMIRYHHCASPDPPRAVPGPHGRRDGINM